MQIEGYDAVRRLLLGILDVCLAGQTEATIPDLEHLRGLRPNQDKGKDWPSTRRSARHRRDWRQWIDIRSINAVKI